MGERPINGRPPLASSSLGGFDAARDGNLAGLRWPPPGWPMFACVTRTSGMALRTSRSEDDFLKYEVTANAEGLYQIEIFSGQVSRASRAGATQTPVIGITFTAQEDWFEDNPGQAVLDIHIRGQRLIAEKSAVLRVILATTFLISRIDRGIAPSLKRVLKLYRLS